MAGASFQAVLMASGTAPKVVTYLTSATDDVDRTTYTLNVTFGTATSDRRIIVGIFGAPTGASTNRTISTVTIGGVSADIICQGGNSGNGEPVTGIAIAAVPTGTSGDVVVTYSGGLARHAIVAWGSTGLTSNTANHSGTSVASPGSVTLNTLDAGFAVAMIGQNDGSTYVWTNATERVDTSVEGAGFSGADNSATSAGTLAVSATYSVVNTRRAMAAASW